MHDANAPLAARIEWTRELMTGNAAQRPGAGMLDGFCHKLVVSDAAREALWILVACELDIGLARIAQSLSGMEFRGFSVPALRDVLARTGSDLSINDLDSLVELALVETTRAPNVTVRRSILSRRSGLSDRARRHGTSRSVV